MMGSTEITRGCVGTSARFLNTENECANIWEVFPPSSDQAFFSCCEQCLLVYAHMKTDGTAEEMDGTAMFSLESRSLLTDMGV